MVGEPGEQTVLLWQHSLDGSMFLLNDVTFSFCKLTTYKDIVPLILPPSPTALYSFGRLPSPKPSAIQNRHSTRHSVSRNTKILALCIVKINSFFKIYPLFYCFYFLRVFDILVCDTVFYTRQPWTLASGGDTFLQNYWKQLFQRCAATLYGKERSLIT
jgi:hypothetical protein